MKIICFPHFYYLSEVSRLIEIGKNLRALKQQVVFFSHGGPYESIARDEGFEVISIPPTMTPERYDEFIKYNRGEGSKSLKASFFTYQELKAYVSAEVDALKQINADAVLIGWNLPSYLSVQVVGIPIIVQQPGSFTAPFFDKKLAEFAPALAGRGLARLLHYLPMDRLVNWLLPKSTFWIYPFNQLAADLGLPQYKSTLDFVAGDLTLVMDTPSILGITPEELRDYRPAHPEYFHKTPKYRFGGACYARLPGEVPEQVSRHFDTPATKLYCAMGVSGSPEVLRSMIDIVRDLDLRALIVTTTILEEGNNDSSGQVLIQPHVPAHLVNPMADFAITHGGAGTVQTAIHAATPIVGIPMHQEQAGNVARVRKRGAGLMLWKSELSRKNLATALEKLISDNSYRHNMLQLKSEQDQIDGPAIAAREIINFMSTG